MQLSVVLFLYFTTLVLVFGLDFIRIAQNRYKSALTSNGIKPHTLIKSALSIPPHVRLKDELNAEEIVLRSTVIICNTIVSYNYMKSNYSNM